MSKRKIVRWLVVLAWLALTIYLSQQSGTESAKLSGGITKVVMKLMDIIGIHGSVATVHYCLRKLAHVGVHLVLAILAYRATVISIGDARMAIGVSWLSCSIVAAFDELIQLAAVGRASDPRVMLLKMLGVSVGIIVGVLITRDKPPR